MRDPKPGVELGRFYGGNSKRIIKKHAHFDFDGIRYKWDSGLLLLSFASKLKPGDIIYNSFTRKWDTIKEIQFVRSHLQDFYHGMRCRGWWISEFCIVTDTNYYIRDIEHWHPFDEKILSDVNWVRFNRQIGMPDYYQGIWYK